MGSSNDKARWFSTPGLEIREGFGTGRASTALGIERTEARRTAGGLRRILATRIL